MKANNLQKIWICINSMWNVFKISSLAIIKSGFGTFEADDANKILRAFSKKVLKNINLKIQVNNLDRFQLKPGTPYILMANHASLYDVPILFYCIPATVRMIAKKELIQIPIWGKAMLKSDFVSIDRQNPKKAMEDLKVAKKKMEKGAVLVVFPEGTRSRTGNILPFKRGAFHLALQAKATIIPVRIHGSANAVPPDTFDFYYNQTVQINIGNFIDTKRYSRSTLPKLVENVRNQILNL